MAMITDRILQLQSNISLICHKLGRNPQDITIVGVTKFATAEKIKEAIESGLTNIGENKVQQAQEKFPSLGPLASKVTRHMIGHLQTNKVKKALELFDVIQSVDSLKLAAEIDKQADKLNRDVDIFLEINTSGEDQKYGISPSDTISVVEEIKDFKRLKIKGLMTMAPFTDDKDTIRECFRILRDLFDQASEKFQDAKNVEMKYLSMGMTADYEIAIEEGSNMVRIGRMIFQE